MIIDTILHAAFALILLLLLILGVAPILIPLGLLIIEDFFLNRRPKKIEASTYRWGRRHRCSHPDCCRIEISEPGY